MTVAIASARLAFGGFSSGSPLVNVRDGFWYRDDFLNTALSTFSVAGTGSNSAGNAAVGHAGVCDHAVSAVADRASYAAGFTSSLPFGNGIAWMVEFLIRIGTLSDAVNRASWRFGFGDTTGGDQVDGAYFEQDLATYGDQFWRMCTASNSVRTKIATTTPPVAGTWHRLAINVDALGTLVTYAIDGATLGTITTNIPTGGGARSTSYLGQMIKTLGAGALTFNSDYAEVIGTFSTRR